MICHMYKEKYTSDTHEQAEPHPAHTSTTQLLSNIDKQSLPVHDKNQDWVQKKISTVIPSKKVNFLQISILRKDTCIFNILSSKYNNRTSNAKYAVYKQQSTTMHRSIAYQRTPQKATHHTFPVFHDANSSKRVGQAYNNPKSEPTTRKKNVSASLENIPHPLQNYQGSD